MHIYLSVDVTFMPTITHQKHLVQSGHSTWSAVDIFNTLRVFTKEPNREQEIKLECINNYMCRVVKISSRTQILWVPPGAGYKCIK